MNEQLLSKIDSLPPLPQTVMELEEYKKNRETDILKLLQIIEKDPLVVAGILKVANSAMFGFRSAVETPSRALNLLGVNFALSIGLNESIRNSIKATLNAYGISADDFMRVCNISSKLLSDWLSSIDYNLKEELILPAFLQETGKFVISDMLEEEKRNEEFLNALKSSNDIAKIEEQYLGTTTSKVTAMIFKHWNLSDTLINSIENVDYPEKAQMKRKNSQILNVIKTICSVCDPMSDENIALGIEKAKKFGLDVPKLQKAIDKMQDRLLEEE